MSVLINATTTNGLQVTPDNSGVIQFQLNGVNVPSPTTVPTFSVYRTSSNQSVTTNTWTKVQLNTKIWDTASAFDVTTNYRFQPTVAGYYQLTGGIMMSGTGMTFFAVEIRINGTETYIGPHFAVPSQGTDIRPTSTALAYLNGSTDYAELWGYITGSGLTFRYGGGVTQPETWFSGVLVRPA